VSSTQLTATLLARNAGRNLLGLGLPLLVALASIPVLTERLDAAAFGVLGLVWVFYGLFAELGLGRATTRYAAASFASGAGHEAREILRVSVLLQLAIGLALMIVLAAASSALAGRLAGDAGTAAQTRSALLVVGLSLPAVMMSAAYRGILEAAHRFDLLNRVRIPLASVTYALPMVIVLGGGGVVLITIALALTRLAATVAYGLLARAVVREHAPPMDSVVEREPPGPLAIIRFGAWQSVSGVLAPTLVHVDRFLLGAIAGVAAVGLYTPAFEVATRLLILPFSIVMALFPAFSAWTGTGQAERSARAAAQSSLYVVAAVAPFVLLFVILGGDGLRLWLNEEYAAESARALAILAVGTLLNAAAFIPASLLAGGGRPDIPSKLYAVELPLYIVLAIMLIGRWGVTGAAAAWSIRVSADAVLLFLAAHHTGMLRLADLRRARVPQFLAGVLLLLLAGASLAALLDAAWYRLGVVAIALASFGGFLWAYGLQAEGRARVAAAVRLVWA
jgi:O-antigen/teichoic acid export membrane protein